MGKVLGPCPGKFVFVLEKYFCTGEIFLYWEKYFRTGRNIFLYWEKHFCTGRNIFVLGEIFLYCPCGPPYILVFFTYVFMQFIRI